MADANLSTSQSIVNLMEHVLKILDEMLKTTQEEFKASPTPAERDKVQMEEYILKQKPREIDTYWKNLQEDKKSKLQKKERFTLCNQDIISSTFQSIQQPSVVKASFEMQVSNRRNATTSFFEYESNVWLLQTNTSPWTKRISIPDLIYFN